MLSGKNKLAKRQKPNLINNKKYMRTENREQKGDADIILEREVICRLVGDGDLMTWIEENNRENPIILRQVIKADDIKNLIRSENPEDYDRAIDLVVERFDEEVYSHHRAA